LSKRIKVHYFYIPLFHKGKNCKFNYNLIYYIAKVKIYNKNIVKNITIKIKGCKNLGCSKHSI